MSDDLKRENELADSLIQNMEEINSEASRPSYLGVAVVARHDPHGPFSADNCYFRTAVNEEEAKQGIEVLVGADLRDRILELERQGWVHLDDDKRQKVMQLGNVR
jgi:hypothetical protein